jgi:hypothetical protein
MIHRGHIDVDNSMLLNRCLSILDSPTKYTSTTRLFENVVQSHLQSLQYKEVSPHSWTEFIPILELINRLSNNTPITNSWFNITGLGGIMNEHMHPMAKHSVFVYYVKCLDIHPPIEIKIADSWIRYPCKTGDWLYFPSKTLHRVQQCHVDETRVSISVNI